MTPTCATRQLHQFAGVNDFYGVIFNTERIPGYDTCTLYSVTVFDKNRNYRSVYWAKDIESVGLLNASEKWIPRSVKSVRKNDLSLNN